MQHTITFAQAITLALYIASPALFILAAGVIFDASERISDFFRSKN